jgi:hypothetical protein
MADKPTNQFLNQVVQIQIQPVDNGFLVQAVNIDGKNKSIRKVATDVEGLRKQVAEIAEELYETPAEPEAASGPTGQESPTGA